MSSSMDFQLRGDAHRELRKLLSMEIPLDGLVMTLTKQRAIDIIAFDDKMRARYPNDYQQDESLHDFMLRRHGKRSVELVLILLSDSARFVNTERAADSLGKVIL